MSEVIPELIKPEELKKMLNIGNDKLYNLLRDRQFPSVKIGGRYYILKNELNNWFLSQTKKNKD